MASRISSGKNHDGLNSGWGVIDALFDILDEKKKGFLDKDDVIQGLNAIGDSTLIDAMANSTRSRDSTDVATSTINKEDLYRVLFEGGEQTLIQKIAMIALLRILPFIYSVSTRLPFICVPLEIINGRGGTLFHVGVFLGLYQTCRAIANLIISSFGGSNPFRRLHIPMTLLGLSGWLLVAFVFQKSVWSFLFLCGVGLSEGKTRYRLIFVLYWLVAAASFYLYVYYDIPCHTITNCLWSTNVLATIYSIFNI